MYVAFKLLHQLISCLITQMLYISSALSLYFPWDFCLYEGMTALVSHFFAYFPFIITVIIIVIILKYRYGSCMHTHECNRKYMRACVTLHLSCTICNSKIAYLSLHI